MLAETIADSVQELLPKIVSAANRLLQRVRVGKTAAERLDYQLAKRSVEQAAAKLWSKGRGARGGAPNVLSNLRDPAFVRLGLDLAEDEYEKDSIGDEKPRWEISDRVARMVLGRGGSLWELLSGPLDTLETELRVRVVEQLARYLTYKEVPFLPDLLAEASEAGLSVDPVESMALFEFMPAFWSSSAGQRWVAQLGAFLHYFVQRDDRQKLEILDGPIKTGDFARHTRDGESRERLREAFNTPLYPMILIANE